MSSTDQAAEFAARIVNTFLDADLQGATLADLIEARKPFHEACDELGLMTGTDSVEIERQAKVAVRAGRDRDEAIEILTTVFKDGIGV